MDPDLQLSSELSAHQKERQLVNAKVDAIMRAMDEYDKELSDLLTEALSEKLSQL